MTALIRGNSTFPSYQIFGGDLYLFWENQRQTAQETVRASLFSLVPDRSVSPPVLRSSNFAEGRPARQSYNFV